MKRMVAALIAASATSSTSCRLASITTKQSRPSNGFAPQDIDAALLNHPYWSDDGGVPSFLRGFEADELGPDTAEFIPQGDQDLLKSERVQ